MSFNIYLTNKFEKELKRLAKKHPSLKSDFAILVASLEENPFQGILMSNNCYKIRMAISSKNRGKSGGARVISHLYIQSETIYLLSIYDKSEIEDMKDNELLEIINSLELE